MTTDPAGLADPVDHILLREAAEAAAATDAGGVVVLDDRSGSLVLGLSALVRAFTTLGHGETGHPIRVSCDSLADETQVAASAAHGEVELDWVAGSDERLFAGARLVVLRLPKSLAALDETAAAIAGFAAPDVVVLAGGRVKHMTHGMNEILGRHFGSVRASLGQQKSRVLIAAEPRPDPDTQYPICAPDDDLGLTVCAHGGAFAGAAVDLGTRFLAGFVDELDPTAGRVVDLGCGTGVLACVVARRWADAEVSAVDESTAACRSAIATVARNGLVGRVTVTRTDLLTGTTDQSVDVVVCNPPFHRGTARQSDVAFAMFADARRALRPGGELWTVFNSHLPYLAALRRQVGSTTVMGQNRHYVVARSRVPAAKSTPAPSTA